MVAKTGIPVFTQPISDPGPGGKGVVTTYWRDFFARIWVATSQLGQDLGWSNPTGVNGSRGSFDMDLAFSVSNPPTQAEVLAIATQVVVLQQRLGQLILDQIDIGVIAEQ